MDCTKQNARFQAYVESKRGKTALEIQCALHHVFEANAPSYSTVKRWIADFRSGKRTSFDDAERSGRPISATGDENANVVLKAIEEDPHISLADIEQETGIAKTKYCLSLA